MYKRRRDNEDEQASDSRSFAYPFANLQRALHLDFQNCVFSSVLCRRDFSLERPVEIAAIFCPF